MKFIPVVLISLIGLLPASLAEKPLYECENGESPQYKLGGYNVGAAPYQNQGTPAGLLMVEDLWRVNFTIAGVDHPVKIWPFTYYNVSYPLDNTHVDMYHHLEEDGKFAFDIKRGVFRGVGVFGGDTEISNDEGLYVNFGGICVKEIAFGTRALFLELHRPSGIYFNETGIVNLYKNGERIETEVSFGNVNGDMEFATDGNDGDDGQEHFVMHSSECFDAMGFVTYSHKDHTDPNKNHDYFLEYLDLCYMPKPVVTGDPHIETWSGKKFDFHGVCDLVLLQNPDFEKGLGMDIHIRTTQLKQFSYVSAAVLRIGDDTLEVMGGNEKSSSWINQHAVEDLDNEIVGLLSGYPIVYNKLYSNQYEYTVTIGGDKTIVMTTFKKFVRVSIRGATIQSFGSSLGLLGSYGEGKMLSRDGSTVIEDSNSFGQEWQVLPYEDKLFHSVEGPQAPEKCYIPMASTLRRRLGGSEISEEEAQFACARVNSEDFDMCIFDVMATGDKDVAGAY